MAELWLAELSNMSADHDNLQTVIVVLALAMNRFQGFIFIELLSF